MRTTLSLSALLLSSGVAFALDYSESVSGDLSNNNLAPTPLIFGLGVNTITGRMGRPDGGEIDPDYFTFTLQPGWSLISIALETVDVIDNSFYAIASGTTISDTNSATHLSNVLMGQPGEYLDDLTAGAYFGGIGLPFPVGPGTYTVWFQEAAVERNYRMSYTVVPEPTAAVAVLGGVGLLLTLRRRRLA